MFAGDGDDELHFGDNWYGQYGYGGYGDDKIYASGNVVNGIGPTRLNGGPGNDQIFAHPYGTTTSVNAQTLYGGPGSDLVEGNHKFGSLQLIFGD